jgi:hypothetical protein
MQLKPGDRIKLIAMPDDPDPIDIGSHGTVRDVTPFEAWTHVFVHWDSGRTLDLSIPPDVVEVIG